MTEVKTTKLFPKGFLLDILDSDEMVSNEIIDLRRWSSFHEMVFKFDGKFYLIEYSQGLTEYQDESPFEYEPEMIECVEVVPVQVSATKYVPV